MANENVLNEIDRDGLVPVLKGLRDEAKKRSESYLCVAADLDRTIKMLEGE